MTTDPTADEFDGCTRRCRIAGQHTRQTGCEYEPEPAKPGPFIWQTITADDGYPSLVAVPYVCPTCAGSAPALAAGGDA